MVTTNDVASVDRLVRVITTAMAAARFCKKDWQKYHLLIFAEMRRQLAPIVETFRRPLAEELKRQFSEEIKLKVEYKGIVLTEWAFVPGMPQHIVCADDLGWLLVRRPENDLIIGGSQILLNIVGDDIGGTQMFIEACAYAVQKLFEEKRRRLDELENRCLLRSMSEAFDPSKFVDTWRFINSLREK